MAYPKKPLSVAQLDGSAAKNPQRYRERSELFSPPLGEPPKSLGPAERGFWAELKELAPWLTKADGPLVTAACLLRAEVANNFTISGVRELRMYYSSMGLTPTSRHNVNAPPPEYDENDPWIQFVGSHNV